MRGRRLKTNDNDTVTTADTLRLWSAYLRSYSPCGFAGTQTLDNIAAQLKELTKAINAFVKREECHASMGDHCSQLKELRSGFEENKSAIRQIINELKRHHGIDITYNG